MQVGNESFFSFWHGEHESEQVSKQPVGAASRAKRLSRPKRLARKKTPRPRIEYERTTIMLTEFQTPTKTASVPERK